MNECIHRIHGSAILIGDIGSLKRDFLQVIVGTRGFVALEGCPLVGSTQLRLGLSLLKGCIERSCDAHKSIRGGIDKLKTLIIESGRACFHARHEIRALRKAFDCGVALIIDVDSQLRGTDRRNPRVDLAIRCLRKSTGGDPRQVASASCNHCGINTGRLIWRMRLQESDLLRGIGLLAETSLEWFSRAHDHSIARRIGMLGRLGDTLIVGLAIVFELDNVRIDHQDIRRRRIIGVSLLSLHKGAKLGVVSARPEITKGRRQSAKDDCDAEQVRLIIKVKLDARTLSEKVLLQNGVPEESRIAGIVPIGCTHKAGLDPEGRGLSERARLSPKGIIKNFFAGKESIRHGTQEEAGLGHCSLRSRKGLLLKLLESAHECRPRPLVQLETQLNVRLADQVGHRQARASRKVGQARLVPECQDIVVGDRLERHKGRAHTGQDRRAIDKSQRDGRPTRNVLRRKLLNLLGPLEALNVDG